VAGETTKIKDMKDPGYLVETKTGLKGRTYHREGKVDGKVIVHTDKGKLLCDPLSIKLTGFID
jgi:hypothetical protein